MIWQELEPLLARDVEAFIDGKWQRGMLTGFGPGYSDDDIEITVMATTRFANRGLAQKEYTFICKQNELATRIRRIVQSVPSEQPLRLEASGRIGNDKKWANIEEYKAWLHSLPKPKFCIGDRVLVTVAIEQIIGEPATVEDVDDEVGLYWCVFDKGLNPQWFTEERLQARQASE